MKIYTKTGDDGTTSLFDGSRVAKNDARVAAYGDVDELNATLGVALSHIEQDDVTQLLTQVQRDLFALGAQLANPTHKKQKQKADFSTDKVTVLETTIDTWEKELKPMTNFILPGGSTASSQLHLARCICRRAERHMVALAQDHEVDEVLIHYINRLSDLLFVAARLMNKRLNVEDIIWDC